MSMAAVSKRIAPIVGCVLALSTVCSSAGAGGTSRTTIESGAREFAHRAIRRRFDHQRQRAGPELSRELLRNRIEKSEPLRILQVADMRDQRIERGPPFGGIECGDRSRVVAARSEAVDGLGREGREFAFAQQARGFRDCRSVGGSAGTLLGKR